MILKKDFSLENYFNNSPSATHIMPRYKSVSIALNIFIIFVITQNVVGKHVCNEMGIDTFCIIGNTFKAIVANSTNPTEIYKQFQKIIDILPVTPYVYAELNKDLNTGQIYSYQTNCELKYVHGPYTPSGSPGDCGTDKLNPYSLNVTEIKVNGERMHNWFHITIKGDSERANLFPGGNVKGKFQYALLIAHDDFSYAIGDFNHQLPCGSDCNCKKPDCYQATAENSIPCMYTQKKVITHPGMLMMYSDTPVSELHATWHFAQYQHPDLFTPELHFKALVIETTEVKKVTADTRAYIDSHSINMEGIIGWNPYYDILWPLDKTLGAWDHFRTGVYNGSLIQCHEAIDTTYYDTEIYPTSGTVARLDKTLTANLLGSKHDHYVAYSNLADQRLYYGYWRPEKATPTRAWDFKTTRSATRGEPKRPTNFPGKYPTVVQDYISKLKTLDKNGAFDEDQCSCHVLGTPPPASEIPPPPLQVQGRKAHATQMIIAWLCIVPFGMFVARYYKETYSKVFFLQEFWWFSMHVLCFVVAAMFMFGGIYSLEIQRKEPIQWGDKNILLHVVIGSVAMGLFVLQLLLGHQRMRDVKLRMFQIMLHWCFGFIEYILAITSILLSATILQGCLPCAAFNIICVWLVFQTMFYVCMEVHMRFVDKELNLEPKRSYLPPPVMRVFHMNAPKSKFRIVILIVYGLCCTAVYAIVHVLIKYNENGQSCYKVLTHPEDTTEAPDAVPEKQNL